MKTAFPPAFWACAMMLSVSVVFPEAATVEAQERVGEEIVKLLLGKLRESGAIR